MARIVPVQPANVFGGYNQGYEIGRKREGENRLSAHLAGGGKITDPAAQNALMALDPAMAVNTQMSQARMDQQQGQFDQSMGLRREQFEADQQHRADMLSLQKQRQAAAEGARIRANADAATARKYKIAGALLGQVLQAPEDQRAAMWTQTLQTAQAQGLSLEGVPQQYPGGAAVTGLYNVLTGEVWEGAGGGDAPAGFRALEMRARAAGLEPGTPEYQQFMVSGGKADTGFAIDVDPATGQTSIRQGAGAGNAPKPFTEGQSKDVVYSTRARGALEYLDPIAGSLRSFGSRVAEGDPTGVVRGAVQSPEYQIAKNLGDEFLQAILRKDTGAAITEQEQELYGNVYLPRPGDSDEVLEEKSRARRRAISAIEAGMSPAQMVAQERGLRAGRGGVDPIRSQVEGLSDDDLMRALGG